MKRSYKNIVSVTLTILCASLTAGWAEEPESDSLGFLVNLESGFTGYAQEGGVADANGASGDLDPSITPQLELGVVFDESWGVLLRTWMYDNDTSSVVGTLIDVTARTLDLELFMRAPINDKSELEYSLGFRGAKFAQQQGGAANAIGEFNGLGGTVAIKGRRQLGIGKVYARGRLSILVGDYDITRASGAGDHTGDISISQTELGFGYEFNIPVSDKVDLGLNVGFEWRNWDNVALADPTFGGIGNDDILEDATFSGLVIGVGAEF